MPCFSLPVAAILATTSPVNEELQWKLNATIGLTVVDSSQKSQTLNGLVSANRETKGVDNVSASAGILNTRQTPAGGGSFSTVQDYWFAGARYDRNVSSRIAAYLSARFRRERPVLLDLRSQFGAGMAYLVKDDEKSNWVLSAGLSFRSEKYTSSLGTQRDTGLEFGSNLDTRLMEKLHLSHSLSYIPKVGQWGDSLTTSILELKYNISPQFGLSFNHVIDYRSKPATGARRKSSQFFLGLAFSTKM